MVMLDRHKENACQQDCARIPMTASSHAKVMAICIVSLNKSSNQDLGSRSTVHNAFLAVIVPLIVKWELMSGGMLNVGRMW